jgi:hypothetical protein
MTSRCTAWDDDRRCVCHQPVASFSTTSHITPASPQYRIVVANVFSSTLEVSKRFYRSFPLQLERERERFNIMVSRITYSMVKIIAVVGCRAVLVVLLIRRLTTIDGDEDGGADGIILSSSLTHIIGVSARFFTVFFVMFFLTYFLLCACVVGVIVSFSCIIN